MNDKEKQEYLKKYNEKMNNRNDTTYLAGETFNKLADFYAQNSMDVLKAFKGDDVELV